MEMEANRKVEVKFLLLEAQHCPVDHMRSIFLFYLSTRQCDQKKIAKSLPKLPKKDFTGKMKDFDTFTKIA